MKRLSRPLIVTGSVLGFCAVVYLVGRAPEPPPAVVAPIETRKTVVAAPRYNEDLAEQVRNVEMRRRNQELEGELQALRERLDAGVAPVAAVPQEPEPLDWPSDLPDAYRPRAFEAVAHRAAEECGMGLEVVSIDCEEFPCIAWTKAKDPSVRAFSMAGCSPWNEAFKNGAAVIGSSGSGGVDGGAGERYFAWMAVPPNAEDLPAAFKRARWRSQSMKEKLGLK